MFTPWGSVSAGTVLAGIAAGLVPQSVPGDMLAAAFPRSKYYTQYDQRRRHPGLSADTLGSIDNKWAATFSGEFWPRLQLVRVCVSLWRWIVDWVRGVGTDNNAHSPWRNSGTAGDLAQVALLQGAQNRNNMAVGLAGGWNTTQEPRHFFLSQLSEGAMSDANIRGCIDGT